MTLVYYRYEEYATASADEWGDYDPRSRRINVRLRSYRVVKKTPKGAWVAESYGPLIWSGKPRFVLDESTKRFACPTLAEALDSFMARKRKQIRLMSRRIDDAEEAMRLALSGTVGSLP